MSTSLSKGSRKRQPLAWLALASAVAVLLFYLAGDLNGSTVTILRTLGWLAIAAAAGSALTFAYRLGDAAIEPGRPSLAEPIGSEISPSIDLDVP